MSFVLKVDNVWKAFNLYRSRRDRFMAALFGGGASRASVKTALAGISFDLQAGESVGIVGENGAGKSSLLKIITGVMAPSSGRVIVNGRVSALLELGLGFDPEFTGRENARFSLNLLGLDTMRTPELVAEIEDFAEIGQYFDEPVRTYSTGMKIRLAFAVATALRPETLIVDEALSVGDAYFQHKCFKRIRRFREEGTTLLFVSHDPGAVISLCDRALLLDAGVIIKDGSPRDVMDFYNALIARKKSNYDIDDSSIGSSERKGTRSGDKAAVITKVAALKDGEPVNGISSGGKLTLRVYFDTKIPIEDFTCGISVRDRLGNELFGTNTRHLEAAPPHYRPGSGGHVDFEFDSVWLGPGHYSVTVALHSGFVHTEGNHDWWDTAFVFHVWPDTTFPMVGLVRLPVSAHWAESRAEDRQSAEDRIT